jgi:hypothetical protein
MTACGPEARYYPGIPRAIGRLAASKCSGAPHGKARPPPTARDRGGNGHGQEATQTLERWEVRFLQSAASSARSSYARSGARRRCGIDPTHPASPSATVPHIQSYVPASATAIRGAGPPGAPAAAKQDDPATDALNTIGAVEDMKDFANNKTDGNSGANDNTYHQRGGRVVRRR